MQLDVTCTVVCDHLKSEELKKMPECIERLHAGSQYRET